MTRSDSEIRERISDNNETRIGTGELEGQVFRCGSCDEKALMNNHVGGERDAQ